MNDLHCSAGPVSTMPGSTSDAQNQMCDTHPQVAAYRRVQGETDSMGCEYLFMCKQCFDAYQEELKASGERECLCDWCKLMKKNVRPHRDFEEGRAGPLYQVCLDCRNQEAEIVQDEYFGDDYDDPRNVDDFPEDYEDDDDVTVHAVDEEEYDPRLDENYDDGCVNDKIDD